MLDQVSGLILLALVLIGSLSYLVRVKLRGEARFERVERQGGSAYLGKSLKQMGYWALQPIGRFVIALGITPNQLSWSSVAFGIAAAYALSLGRFGIASLVSAAALLCDALDGLVARERRLNSPAGEVLDSVLDRYVDFLFLSGLLLYYRFHPWLQVFCLLALLGSFMVSYSTAKAEAMGVKIPPGGMRRPERMVYLLLGSVFSALTVPFEPVGDGETPIAYPMTIALVIVGVVSNITAALRFRATARGPRARAGAASARPMARSR